MKSIIHLINTATRDLRVTNSELRVLLSLVTFNGKNNIYAGLSAIGKAIGVTSTHDVSRRLKKLEQYGYIKIQRRQRKSNIYTFNLSQPESKPEKKIKPKAEVVQKPEKEMSPKASKTKQPANPYLWGLVQTYKTMTGAETSPAYAMIKKFLKLRQDLTDLRATLLLMSVLKANEGKVQHDKFNGIIYNSYREASYSQLRKRFDETPAVQFNEYEVLN